MSIFSKLFGKKEIKDNDNQITETQTVQTQKSDILVAVGDDLLFKVSRILTNEQMEKVNQSTIPVLSTQLYMHYWADNLICSDPNDQTWQNQVVFFWKANEPFPKKSLPPFFETFKVKNFIFVSAISLKTGQAAPWFGMPGLGQKHFCEIHGQKVSIPELNEIGVVDYIENVELTSENYDILTDKDQYFLIVDEDIVQVNNNNFYVQEKIVPIELAYGIGGIHIVKKTSLQ